MRRSALLVACVLLGGIGTAAAEPVLLDADQLEAVTAGYGFFLAHKNIGVGNGG